MENGAHEQSNHSITTFEHRLPAISGTQAIANTFRNARPISTNLESLDTILGSAHNQTFSTGIQRGVVTEVYGPPGVGKTTFALQLALNVLHDPNGTSKVAWVSAGYPLARSRLEQLIAASEGKTQYSQDSHFPSQKRRASDALGENFNYREISSLPKLLVLFMHGIGAWPPEDTTLVVIDDLSNLLLTSLPRAHVKRNDPSQHQQTPTAARADPVSKQNTARRLTILSNFAAALQRFAAARNIAVVLSSKANMSVKPGRRAYLRPALSSRQWDSYLATRIFLYCDFWSDAFEVEGDRTLANSSNEERNRHARFAKVTRLRGRDISSREVGFVIEKAGIRSVRTPGTPDELDRAPRIVLKLTDLADTANPPKRRPTDLGAQNFSCTEDQDDATTDQLVKRKAAEIADSEDEEEFQRKAPPAEPHAFSKATDQRVLSLLDNEIDLGEVSRPAQRLANDLSRDRKDQVQSPGFPPLTHINGYRHNEEMLLDQDELAVPLFGQEAAQCSDPLTPSDHGEPSP